MAWRGNAPTVVAFDGGGRLGVLEASPATAMVAQVDDLEATTRLIETLALAVERRRAASRSATEAASSAPARVLIVIDDIEALAANLEGTAAAAQRAGSTPSIG